MRYLLLSILLCGCQLTFEYPPTISCDKLKQDIDTYRFASNQQVLFYYGEPIYTKDERINIGRPYNGPYIDASVWTYQCIDGKSLQIVSSKYNGSILEYRTLK